MNSSLMISFALVFGSLVFSNYDSIFDKTLNLNFSQPASLNGDEFVLNDKPQKAISSFNFEESYLAYNEPKRIEKRVVEVREIERKKELIQQAISTKSAAPVVQNKESIEQIETNELIKHYGFTPSIPSEVMDKNLFIPSEQSIVNTSNIATTDNYDPTKVAFESYLDTIVKDVVASRKNAIVKNETPSDELVFIDYEKELKGNKNKIAAQSNKKPQYTPMPEDFLSMKMSAPARKNTNSKTEIILLYSDLKKSPEAMSQDVDFIEHADESTITTSENSKLVLEKNINRKNSIVNGLIVGKDTIRTRVDLVLTKNKELFFEVPMIDRSSFYDLLEKQDALDYGGFLLVDHLEESIQEVEIDSFYRKKIFLDASLRPTKPEGGYSYTLFASVAPGNVTISYKTNSGSAFKYAHITADELYFDSSFIEPASKKIINVFKKKLLANKNIASNLEQERIKYLGSTKSAVQINQSRYKVYQGPVIQGERKYLSIEAAFAQFFVGYDDTNNLIIPGKERYHTYLDYLGLDEIKNVCVVQLDFKKNPIDIMINSMTAKGSIAFDELYMTRDGDFYNAFENYSQSLFLIGDSRGVFNIKVEYDDQSSDYLKTYCNDSIYLLEHL